MSQTVIWFYVREYGDKRDWRDLPARTVSVHDVDSDKDVIDLIVKVALDAVTGPVHEIFWMYVNDGIVRQISFESWEFEPKQTFESTWVYQKWNDDLGRWEDTTLGQIIREESVEALDAILRCFDLQLPAMTWDRGYRRIDSITREID